MSEPIPNRDVGIGRRIVDPQPQLRKVACKGLEVRTRESSHLECHVVQLEQICIDGGFSTAAALNLGFPRGKEIGEVFEDWE